MADKLMARQDGDWTAVYLMPDVCKTPMGGSTPPSALSGHCDPWQALAVARLAPSAGRKRRAALCESMSGHTGGAAARVFETGNPWRINRLVDGKIALAQRA